MRGRCAPTLADIFFVHVAARWLAHMPAGPLARAQGKFREITEAYEILADKEKRVVYDFNGIGAVRKMGQGDQGACTHARARIDGASRARASGPSREARALLMPHRALPAWLWRVRRWRWLAIRHVLWRRRAAAGQSARAQHGH